MTELQGAVALAQLERVQEITTRRNQLGTQLNGLIGKIPGVKSQHVPAGCRHSYFLYFFKLDFSLLSCTSREFSAALAAEGIPNEAHLITGGRPVYLYDIFQKRSAFPLSTLPFASRTYNKGDCPIAEGAFSSWITMSMYEHYSNGDIQEIAFGIAKVARHFSRAKAELRKSALAV